MTEREPSTLLNGDLHDNSKAASTSGSDDEHSNSMRGATGGALNEKDVGSEGAQQSLEKLGTAGSAESNRDPKLVSWLSPLQNSEETDTSCR
jgi:hypothetical protein